MSTEIFKRGTFHFTLDLMPAHNLETGQPVHVSWWIFIWPGVHFVPCLVLCQLRAPPHVDSIEEHHMVVNAAPSINIVTFAFILWWDGKGETPLLLRERVYAWNRTEHRIQFFHVMKISFSLFFFFFFGLVNKSRVLAKVIYLHTQVLGYVPNSAFSVNMNKPFKDK